MVSSPYHLAGDFASMISWGGAYESSKLSGREIMNVSQKAAEEIIGDDFKNVSVYINSLAWLSLIHI